MAKLRSLFILMLFSFQYDLVESQVFFTEHKIDSFTVYFDLGKYKINDEETLLNFLDKTNISDLGRIELKASTDSIGSEESNLKLASKRLKSVLNFVRESHLKKLKVDTINLSEQNDSAMLAQNRKVDIFIYEVTPTFKLNSTIRLNIEFEAGADILLRSSYQALENLYNILSIDTTLKVKLNGHVCCQPSYEMSLLRAKRVEKYLIKRGINRKRISCFGYSNTVKLAEEINEANKQRNRRVEVEFYK